MEQPFDGIRVVEFGQFVAVPFAAQLLAEGGARVIKVEALQGDPTRRLGQVAPGESRVFLSRNRGKHSLPLALSDPRSEPVREALLGWADVALMNFRPGIAARLGLGADTLCQRFPRLVVGTVTAFGAAGPEAGLPGMDLVVQARSGLMAANGRLIDGRPASGEPVISDYMCAMSLAFGVSAALLRRERTGKGGRVDTSLMQAAMALANTQLVRLEAQDGPRHQAALQALAEQRSRGTPFEEQLAGVPSPANLPIIKVYLRTYETADAAIAVACGSHALRLQFMKTIGLEDPGLKTVDPGRWQAHYDEFAVQVERRMREKSCDEWTALLRRAGVPVSPVKFPLEMFDDPQTRANGMFSTLDHPTAGPVQVPSPPVRLDARGFQPAPATGRFGSETETVLEELGFGRAAIGELIDAGVTLRAD